MSSGARAAWRWVRRVVGAAVPVVAFTLAEEAGAVSQYMRNATGRTVVLGTVSVALTMCWWVRAAWTRTAAQAAGYARGHEDGLTIAQAAFEEGFGQGEQHGRTTGTTHGYRVGFSAGMAMGVQRLTVLWDAVEQSGRLEDGEPDDPTATHQAPDQPEISEAEPRLKLLP